MDDKAKEERPNLFHLLESQLTELGLDPETYGPYVIGTEADEVPDVVELLKASSEIDEDNDDLWEQFTQDILKSLQLDERYLEEQKQEKKKQAQQLAQERAEKNKAAIKEKQASTANKKSSQVDDETKMALMQRFGYEMPEGEEDEVVTNKQAAATAHMEKAKEMRSKKTQTKKEEQQKTKDQKASKAQLKEERRKRTQKGERKR